MSSSPDTVSSARSLALSHLERVRRDEAFVDKLTADGADARTRRQARELVAGVTRQRRWLDFVLGEAYHDDYESMEHRLRQILRLGLYELLFQSTPTHAAVDEYVELAKQELRPGAGNLVNGVLRTIDRDREHIPTPNTGDDAEDLAIRYSHPTWMVRRWLGRFGVDETTELLRANNRRPMYGVRVNPLRTTQAEVSEWLDDHDVVHVDSPYLDNHLRLKRLQALIEGGLLDDGRVAVQDESAGLVVALLDPQPGDTLADGCAAPGGKTLHAAARMEGQGTIRAVDTHEQRLGRVGTAAETHGVRHMVQTEAADLRRVAERSDPPQADRVLLDVPCTGLGVLAKRAGLRWRCEPSALDEMTALQDDLLDAAAALVRPGGLLVYSTCSIVPEENEHRIDDFLARHIEFTAESASGHVPDEVVSEAGFLATLPHRHRTDGAFAARLRRVSS
ncbi:MAG: 16S rRNA (cytosine(967)-C(5))-methyltransferase RsmB [Salinibacter sp.]|uniref:16S rRNA (cytosine(967)-C(5))-methyltransferase RsmB n=1 Tax=Salinibacter sp. TaxID=2065818 RepID=UPI0035D52978